MRDYKAEYDNYHAAPDAKKKRAERNKARRMLVKEGAVKKGDGKDVDHITPLGKGGKTVRSNLRVQSAAANRSFKRKADGTQK
jgi:hypothetical protein